MRIAWLRGDLPHKTDALDDGAVLVEALRLNHEIELFTSETARDFAASHERSPFDLAVYEIGSAPASAALLPLLVRVGGALMLRTLALPDLLSALRAARVTVVSSRSIADDLRVQYPGYQIRVAATGISEVRHLRPAQRDHGVLAERQSPVVFGTLSASRADLLRRVFDRAGVGGETAELMADRPPEQVLREADVIVSLPWPWAGEPGTEALAAMAAGKPVVVLETAGTADWPALDPQSWQPRGRAAETPIVVSVDPLDEEHSLGLAVVRLSADAPLRGRLGAAAKDWWRLHATPQHAAADWERILNEAKVSATPTLEGQQP
jgi:hypothetical protein